MKATYLFLLLALLIVSCSSNSDNDIVNEEPDDFYALEVGNTWVYKYYSENQNTNEFTNDLEITDSVSIISTESIRDNVYYKFRQFRTNNENPNHPYPQGEGESFYFLRDSLGNLVEDNGKILFWNNYWEERLWYPFNNDPTHAIFAKLNENITLVNIEAGNFDCQVLECYLKNIDTGEQNQTASYFYYADGVGNICEKIGYLNGPLIVYEKRLDSYNFE